ncbi:hypothetical protein [Alienimonas chondri]|uniref:DUF4424 domain-containing protein n=1 Tax=Alienimonas chondri TaxID=2681879 RepID=A0ABX1V7N3_9PLAN|nr:hypothetical protein [Alienimonas chondri]NNJ23962.1 hypothetical protein [Alienimonas chondri]
MTPLLLVALALSPFGETADGDAGAHLLRYQFAPGESLRHEITTAVTIDSLMQGNAQIVRNGGTTVQRIDVLPLPADAKPGTAGVLRVTSEKVKLSAQFNLEPPTGYDSESTEPVADGYQAVDAVAKAPLGELTVSELGEVTHAKSLLPGMEDLDAEKATDAYRDLYPHMPVEPVTVGETWTEMLTVRVQEGQLLKPWKLRRLSTLTKVEDGIATITVKVTPLPPPVDPAFQEQLAMKCPAGLMEFDIAKGRILSLRADVDAEIIGFRGPGGLLKLKSTHVQRLIESGPTSELRVSRTAAASVR